MRFDLKTTIKIVIAIILLIVLIVLFYNNFIKKDTVDFQLDSYNYNKESDASGIDLSIFEDEVFKNLIKSKEVIMPTEDELGKDNPFLK